MSARSILVAACGCLALAACGVTSGSSLSAGSGTTSVPSSTSVPASPSAPSTDPTPTGPPSTEASSSAPSATTPVTRTAASDALHARMVPAVAGFVLQPDSVGDTGPSDLAKALRDAGDPSSANELRQDGFVVGYQELFVDDAQSQVILFVYQFPTAAQAQRNCAANAALQLAGAGSGATLSRIDVPGVPGAVAISGIGQGKVVTIIGFARGPYCAQVESNGSDPNPSLPALTAIVATQQYTRLG